MLIKYTAVLVLLALCSSPTYSAGLSPLPTANTEVTAPADSEHFTFAVGGDNRSTGHGYPVPPCFEEICAEIGTIRPSFVLWSGDCIEGYQDTPDEANAEYDELLKDLSMTGVPVFNAPGNHEFTLDVQHLLPIYEKRMGQLYGSFDYGNSHFIALNTNAVNANGTLTEGTLDDAQWAWLEGDLEAATATAKNIFVFMHHYPFGPPDPDTPDIDTGWKSTADRDRLHAMMVKYGVRAVIAGHNHIYWHMSKDGVEYYISGGSGAPLDASPEKGGYLHYLLFHVDGSKIAIDILQPWHLLVRYPRGDGNGSATETAWIENTNRLVLKVEGLVFHVNAPPAGHTLTVTARTNIKGGAIRPATAKILSTTPSADGKSVTAVVEVTVTPARTTVVTVGP